MGNVNSFFQDVTGWTQGPIADPHNYSANLVDLEPGWVYPAAAGSFNATLSITINNEFTVEIPTHELWRPLRGLDGSGNVVLDSRFNELQVYGSKAAGYAPVLGKAFLSQVRKLHSRFNVRKASDKSFSSQVYVFVDYEANPPIFKLAPLTSGPTAPAAVSSASCSTGLSVEDKGLIAMGSVLGAIIAGGLLFALYRYCWARQTPAEKEKEEEGTEAGGRQSGAPSPASSVHVLGEDATVDERPDDGVSRTQESIGERAATPGLGYAGTNGQRSHLSEEDWR